MDYLIAVVFLFAVLLLGAIGSLWFIALHARRQLAHLRRHVWNTATVSKMVPDGVSLPAPEGWAASSDVLSLLIDMIRKKRPEVVVELGSGISTVVLAAALAL
ncbi:MAG: hypothetical protein KGY49_13355, partial [Wenzhouxiangellaceae bacterium]|nr:hypothetical protein [Wenzhouxiangellaceae bacterium]